MVSVRRKSSKVINLVKADPNRDIVPFIEAHIKGQKIPKVYVDGGAQICVMTEKLMQRLGLKVDTPSLYKAKLANNSTVKCVGVIKGVKVNVCGLEAEVDMHVMPTKGEGYPFIPGRPWLICIKVDQRWESGMLVLKPQTEKGGERKPFTYDMKCGRPMDLGYETTVDEFSSSESTSSGSEMSSETEDSSLEVMGLVLREPISQEQGESTNMPKIELARLEGMIAKILPQDEKSLYVEMLKKYWDLFATDYTHIIRVSVIEHHIELKEGLKPVTQKLRRLGEVQREAQLTEVRRLLQADFI